ncbi:Spx/MgsR family RNA polymerase-binding regulatory protein [Brevibacillus sp. H7]|jgi:regulatory protein spx|uniref:Spx/MgsR family RNA polymerase-binding regulatory protein n=1 Tax=Brevibacillus sp. H7 TaxID=3349138 RepID=UPI0037FA4C43
MANQTTAKKITFFTYPSSTSAIKTKAWLTKHGVNYEERHLLKKPPTVDELMEIAKLTKQGMDELLATRSQEFKQLGVNIEELTVSELLTLLSEKPQLLKKPIITDGKNLIVGYDSAALETILKSE